MVIRKMTSPQSDSSMLTETDRQWLDVRAEALDAGDGVATAATVPWLAEAGLLGHGVDTASGGQGGRAGDAIEAIAQVAAHSMSAAFAFWGQRVLIEMLARTGNAALRERWLPALLAGEAAGASGLSNSMKFLSGLEALNIRATAREGGGWLLNGSVPWCTNLRGPRFLAAIAVARDDGAPPMIVALPSDRAGLERSPDLELMALRGTNTAALRLTDVAITEDDLLAERAGAFLPRVRPAFLGMQCGLSIGLARAACAQAAARMGQGGHVLQQSLDETRGHLEQAVSALKSGVEGGDFVEAPERLPRRAPA
jgi:alkylation response protein AidB-like acyl-CoA dehydrogenase